MLTGDESGFFLIGSKSDVFFIDYEGYFNYLFLI